MQTELEEEIEKIKEYLIIVEGKKDKIALENLGLKHIFVINQPSKSLYEKIEEIENIANNKKICILTDFDKKGRKLYLIINSELSQRKVKLDNNFRLFLSRLKIIYIEDLKNE